MLRDETTSCLRVLASQSALAQNQRSSHNSSALRSRLNLEASEVGGLSDSVPAPLAGRSGASRRSGGGATLLGCPPGLSLSLRHRASTPVRRAACCAGGFVCVALVESVLRPSGWEKKCRLTCHCVRHISPDNKHGQPVKARHSLPSRWRAGTELCVPTNRKSRAARRARWGARTVQGAHAGFGSPSWFGQFPPGLTAQVSKLVEHS